MHESSDRPQPGAAEPGELYATQIRLQATEAVVDVELSRLDLNDMLAELLERARQNLKTDTAAILLMDDSGRFLVASAARGLEAEVRQGSRVPLGRGFAGRVAATRRPVIIEVAPGQVVNPVLLRKGVRSMLGVPLLRGDDVLGVLHVGTLHPREFGPDDIALLELVADRAALAIAAARVAADRAAATALQRSLCPQQLPTVAGLDLAARYVPGSQYGVGGDWYDVFELPAGQLGIAVGDVMGHGLRAATTMGRMRSALRAYALDDRDPARVLERLDRMVQYFEPAQMGTVIYGVLDADHDELRLSAAGHLPPAVAHAQPAAQLAELPIDLPIGVQPGVPRRSTTLRLPGQYLVCLFTDGLVERRQGDIDASLDALCAVLSAQVAPGGSDAAASAAGEPPSAEAVCAEVMAALVGEWQPADDISLLVIGRGARRD